MPGCDVTVTATFSATADQQAVENAATLIPATFTVAQSTANTQADVKNWLVSRINTLIASTGITVSASDLTVSDFAQATAGTANVPSGVNGSFSVTVTLRKGSAFLTTAAKAGTITATPYPITPYTVTVVPTTDGTVAVSPSNPFYYAGATITVSLTPSANYGLASIQVYRTGVPSTTVTLSGSDNTRTFVMPAHDVTVEATFLPTSQLSAQQDLNSARSLIENALFNVLQDTANTSLEVRTWLVRQINTLIASTGVTVSASDITVSGFTAATAGTVALPTGANGRYTFTVSLTKSGFTAVTSAKTGRITATAYMPPVRYAITFETSSNGRVTTNVASAPAGTTVTLTITPNAGYELDSIRVRMTDGTFAPVALSASGNTCTFIMPACAVTVSAWFKKTQELINRETLEEAKVSVESGHYRIAQATSNTEAAVETWLTDVLSLLLLDRNVVITLRSGEADVLAADVRLTSFTAAVSGTEANPAGANGSFQFIVVLTKGTVHVQTLEVNGVIVATPYAATPVKRIELLSMGETRVRIINTGNQETGNLTASLSGANADVFTLPSADLGSLTIGDEANFALVLRENLTPGLYTVTVTVGGDGLAAISLEITYRVLPVGNEAIAGQRVWAAGNTLYLVATTTGEARVFNVGGQLVKVISHTADGTVKTILPQGFYIVTAEGKTHKVMIHNE
jgi:hypothetical protein